MSPLSNKKVREDDTEIRLIREETKNMILEESIMTAKAIQEGFEKVDKSIDRKLAKLASKQDLTNWVFKMDQEIKTQLRDEFTGHLAKDHRSFPPPKGTAVARFSPKTLIAIISSLVALLSAVVFSLLKLV